jgi:hypothetical protein
MPRLEDGLRTKNIVAMTAIGMKKIPIAKAPTMTMAYEPPTSIQITK